jgi:hypothetical protein
MDSVDGLGQQAGRHRPKATRPSNKASRNIRRALVNFERAVFVLSATVLLILAYFELRQAVNFADLFVVAERIEQSEPVSDRNLTSAYLQSERIIGEDVCRSDIVMAGATVVLADFDNKNEITDYETWSRALSLAERYFSHAISCMPTSSNFWLRLAVLRAVTAEEPEETARLMGIATRLAPADQFSILARVYFWNHLSGPTLERAATDVTDDLRLLFRLGESPKIAAVLPTLSTHLFPYARDALKDLSLERRTRLMRAGVDIANIQR